LYDALVVGGGPVGSYIARKLSCKGYSVGVLDKGSSENKSVCCTGIISKKCYRSFLNEKNLILKTGKSARVYSPSGKLLNLSHKEDQAYIINRNALDAVMAGDAIDNGAEYFYGCTVKNIVIKNDRAHINYSKGGEFQSLDARLVIVASGFGSWLLGDIGINKPADYTIGAQIEVHHRDIEGIEIYTGRHIAPGFFGWLVPLDEKKALAGLMAKQTPNKYLKEFLSLLKEQGKIDVNGDTPAYRGITLKPPKRTYGERFIIVGDAAGQVKPLTGGGIYFGLLCADIAVNNVDKALKDGDLRAVKLAAYDKEWRNKLNRELRICRMAQHIYSRLNNRQLDRILAIGKDSGIVDGIIASNDLDFDYHGRVIRKAITFPAISKLLLREIAQ
jgi:geranylgeranyl reductase family protein